MLIPRSAGRVQAAAIEQVKRVFRLIAQRRSEARAPKADDIDRGDGVSAGLDRKRRYIFADRGR